MDRPAGRERRRRALPLGLHADRRPRRRAQRDRRVLRPGGRVALAVWDAIEHNPWAARLRLELLTSAAWPSRSAPGTPAGPFALGDADRAARAARARGLHRCRLSTALDLIRRHPSFEEFWETHARPLAQLPRGRHVPARGRDREIAGRARGAPRALHGTPTARSRCRTLVRALRRSSASACERTPSGRPIACRP